MRVGFLGAKSFSAPNLDSNYVELQYAHHGPGEDIAKKHRKRGTIVTIVPCAENKF